MNGLLLMGCPYNNGVIKIIEKLIVNYDSFCVKCKHKVIPNHEVTKYLV